MTRYQKSILLIGVLILVALLALVLVMLTRPTAADILAVSGETQTAGAILGATQASIDYGNTLAVAATQTEGAYSALLATATWVVEQNMTVESYLAATRTAQASD